MLAAIIVLLLGSLSITLGLRPLLTGSMSVGLEGKSLPARLANWWTIGAGRGYAMRPFTARFVGLLLVAVGGLSVVLSIRTIIA